VRLTIGDTDTANAQLSDPEIEHFLAEEGNELYAAARACEAIAAKNATCTDQSGGGISKSASQVYAHYMALALRLRTRGARATMRVPAVSVAAKEADRSDPDLVAPYFRLGMDDNPRAARESDDQLDDGDV
jgi:hypothetical protein